MLLSVLLLVTAVLMVVAYVKEAPLRGGGLVRAQAEVVTFDNSRDGADHIEVRYEVPGEGVRSARIAVRAHYAEGDRVEVLYVPDDPGRVRTAQAWAPTLQPKVIIATLTVTALMPLVVLGRVWWLQRRRVHEPVMNPGR